MKLKCTSHVLLSVLCLLHIITGVFPLVFTLPSYGASVPETFPEDGFDLPPDGFLRVACIDEATGIPITTVEYSITGGNSGPFEVNPTNGDLSVADGQILDYETATSYAFTVMCTNTSNVTLTATAPVTITLEPVNEFQPVVSVNNLIISVVETAPIGTIIVSTQPGGLRMYSVTDRDAGPDGVITYTLMQDETSNSFRVNLTTGSLELVQSLDVDNTRNPFVTISVLITACDENPPRLDCPNIRISLIIISANDNNPVFSSDRYEVSLPESAPIGTVVATPECTDGDVGAGEYQGIEIASNNDDGLFIIPNARNGIVNLNNSLDYEMNRTHTISLVCRDNQGRLATAEIIVTVLPLNDNAPQFSQETYEFSVNRLSILDSRVGQVFASDLDVNEDGEDTLTITFEGDTTNFGLKDDGTITVQGFILALEGSSFELTVTVDDGMFNSSSTVLITVDGLLSIPDVILIAVGGIILLVLVCILFVCVCTCGLKCGRIRPAKESSSESTDNLNKPLPEHNNMMPMMHDNFYGHVPTQPYMVFQVPTDDRKWTSSQNDSDEDDPDYASVSHASGSTGRMIGPVLQEMVDMFHEGDKIITKNKK